MRRAQRAGLTFLVLVVAAWGVGLVQRLSVVDLFVLAVPAAVVPAVARVASAGVSPAVAVVTVATTPLVALAFLFDPGRTAAVFVVPWAAVAGAGAVTAAAAAFTRTAGTTAAGPSTAIGAFPRRAHPAELVVAVYLAVAAASLLLSRAGFTFRHLVEPIIELTAVHYGFAGAGATTVALAAARFRPGRRTTAALVLVAASSPLVALGFVTRHPLFQVGAAVTLTVGILVVGLVTCTEVARVATGRTTARLLRVAALAPVVPMGLAVAWAAGQHWSVPALDVDAMARTHGLLNAVGFVGCGLLGYRRLFQEERIPC